MIEVLFELYLRTLLQALPILTAAASGRRALRSRSINGALYTFVFLFSCAAAIGMSGGLFEGRPAEAGRALPPAAAALTPRTRARAVACTGR